MDEHEQNVNQNGFDKIIVRNIEKEMKESYINYAMSVIVSRALPDVRDGLKPVHRRILYSMNELNLDYNKPYKKSARIVGDTMGKYHPHGDSSIYGALVRMAQEFSMRYMLVDGHGNFGSVDGDGAAAARYTEARLSRISMEMISDIEKETVDFVPNYDEEFTEPTVLPAKFPNLLVNGSAGIAVGMATNIPPHNLTESVNCVIKIIDNYITESRETDIEELIEILKAPDFPTGATIIGTSGIKAAYRTGRGKVIVRSDVTIEPMPNGREMMIVSEIPYQVNKSRLLEKIGELVKDKRVEGISDMRDESDRNGIRIVIELKKDANANVILNNLYKHTQLQESFGILMLALVDNQPRVLNIKEMLTAYLKHQKDVVTRRTRFDLNKAARRAHIVEGFLKALDYIDEIISIIRSNREISKSKEIIIERYGFTQEQADAITEMRLRSLSGLEGERLENEFGDLKNLIVYLQSILDDEMKLYSVIKEELTVIRDKYGDERKTKVVPYIGEIEDEDLIEEETSVITMTHFDYVKRLPLNTYKSQNRGGKGIMGMATRDEDLIQNLVIASTHDYLLFFTNMGRVYRIKAYEIPEAGRTARGTAIVNLLNLQGGEKITAVIPFRDYDGGYLVMITKNGLIKKTETDQFKNIRVKGLIALNIHDDDELIKVMKTDGESNIFIATSKGMGICFNEDSVRSMGRTAAGVKAIDLADDDFVVGAEMVLEDHKILVVSSSGYGKCTEFENFRLQKRNGKGLKIHKVTDKTGELVGTSMVTDKEELMLINSNGIIIRIRIAEISTTGRIAQGVKLINLEDGVKVVSLAKVAEDQIEEEAETDATVTEESDQFPVE
ncbi:MAG: DNA gyrase subunit A [Clostridiales bacterium]|jgi:DNA gyrase subunit A|nr:DNA gyrase subunit A [Clostridiales bacterium]